MAGENDDYGETAADAGVLPIDGSATGEVEFAGDIDWFAVILAAGVTYRFDHFGSDSGAGGGTLSDPVVEGLFNPTGNLIPGTFNDDSNGTLNSQITYTAQVSGTHHIAVRGLFGTTPELGTYTVSATTVRPDFKVQNAVLSDTTWVISENQTVSFTAVNSGAGNGPTGVGYGIYLSPNPEITDTDLLLASVTPANLTTPGSSQTFSETLLLPSALTAGTYYLGVLADDLKTADEAQENNNVSTIFQVEVLAAPVTLLDGSGDVIDTFSTIANALDHADSGDRIEVSGASYGAGPETLTTGLNGLLIDVGDASGPSIGLEESGATALSTLGSTGVNLTGNSEANLLSSGGGTDTLLGGGGDDTLSGGEGADVLSGGTGANWVSYQASTARVIVDVASTVSQTGGHAEGDLLSDIQHVIGSGFNDLLVGSSSANGFDGGAMADNLNGLGGDDTLRGEAGNDLISGGNHSDLLEGGSGDDTLFGNGGDDDLVGGADADTIFGGAGDDSATGGDGVDEVSGQGGADTIHGDDGADILRGGSGNDVIEGGQGNDRIFGNGNNDTLSGDEGNDVIQGAAGVDWLIGGAGNDNLSGGLGGDRLDGGTGNDTMNGGGSDGVRDVYVFAVGYDLDRINAFDQLGTDRIELDAALWSGTNPGLSAQQVVDTFGTLNGPGNILTLDFGGGDILEIQNAAGINAATLGADLLIV